MSSPTSLENEILIAEDSPTQALKLENVLEKNGFRVQVARNGRLAFESLRDPLPTMVITDIQMPEMDGYELCRRVKSDAHFRNIPVMLVTSLSAPEDIIRGLECGADNFVVKPYEESFLMSRVRTILTNRKLETGDRDADGLPIFFAGHQYVINSDRRQILNLLLSTYETALKTNQDLIKAHEELKRAQAQLIEAEKLQSLGRLAAGVAHEVRNPLAILEMGMTFMEDLSVPEDARMILSEMKEAVGRTNVVITSLMDLSTHREGGMQKASVNEVIEEALRAVEQNAAGITIKRQLDPALPPTLLDFDKLTQVFINVFTNAIQAMPDGGTLSIRSTVKTLGADEVDYDVGDRTGERLREGEKAAVVEVQDTGSGIEPDDLGKVFEPFFSTKSTGQGMGLGLTVARKIVEAHSGRIAVRNAPGGGTLVTIAFKLA